MRSAVRLWQTAEGGNEDAYVKNLLAQEEAKRVLLNHSTGGVLGHRRSKSKRLVAVSFTVVVSLSLYFTLRCVLLCARALDAAGS